MANLIERAIDCDDGNRAAKIIRQVFRIESDEVAHHVLPKAWPADREQRARIIGEWLQTGAALAPIPSKPSVPPMQSLRFESDPPGAEV
jgi:uncharacterized protein HemY